jgi:hypothetical protein
MINWYFGWGSILCAFVSGAAIGLHFYRDDFLGGYTMFRRRMLRLGHIALAGLGIINILYAQGSFASVETETGTVASIAFIVGGVTMPAVCFLSAWRPVFRCLFVIPVVALIAAVIQTIRIGTP